MLELLISGCRGDEKTVPVPCCETTDNAGTTNAGVNDGNDVSKLGLKCGIKICTAADGSETVTK